MSIPKRARLLAKTIKSPEPIKTARLYSILFTVTASGHICQFFSCRDGQFQDAISAGPYPALGKTVSVSPHRRKKSQEAISTVLHFCEHLTV